MTNMKAKYILLCTLGFVLLSCTSRTNIKNDVNKMTFDRVQTYPVNVASYQPASFKQDKNIVLPSGFHADPEQAIFDYLQSRFVPTGNIGKLKAYIQSVDVTYNKEESQNAVAAFMTLDEQDVYTITAEIAFEVLGTQTIEREVQVLKIMRQIKQPEHLTLAEREKAQFEAIDGMIDDLDIAIREDLMQRYNML